MHNAFDNEFITFLNIQCDCITLGNRWCEVNEIGGDLIVTYGGIGFTDLTMFSLYFNC